MINDAIILEFRFDDGTNEIRPPFVSNIVNHLENIFQITTKELRAESRVELFFIAAPTSGSLRFHLNAHFNMSPNAEMFLSRFLSEINIEEGANLTTIGAGIWIILFGGRGLFEMIKKSKEEIRRLAEVEINVAARVLASHPDLLDGLTKQALASGASEVRIIIPDQPPTIVFSTIERRNVSLIGRRSRIDRKSLEPPDELFHPESPKTWGVEFGGVRRVAFLASIPGAGTQNYKVVVIWGSQRKVPSPTRTQRREPTIPIQGQWIDPATVTWPNIPPDFEDAVGVVFVKSVAVYE